MSAPTGMSATHRGRAGLVALAALVVLVALPTPDPAGALSFSPSSESTLLSLVGNERAAAGQGPLTPHPDLQAAARRQAQAMAAAGRIYHNPDLASVASGWSLLGENVAMAPGVESAHRALMASPGHRANILEPRFTHVGVGVAVEGSTVWVVEVFMASTTSPSFTPPFSDDDGSVHETDIGRLEAAGVTGGCAASLFCPQSPVTREQMATFLSRAAGLVPVGIDHFVDDDGSFHETDINSAADAGITRGCAPAAYCPTRTVSRADMAVFLANTLELPPSGRDHFSDDDGWPQEWAINALADAGVTRGCGPGRYCPGEAVTRAQMASYLVRAFGL